MNRFFAPILLLTLLFPALAFGETMDDLVQRPKWTGLYYKKFTEVPFTGKVTGKSRGSFKDGKRDGPWVVYHKNGQLDEKVTYKNGEPDGPWVKYGKDGQLWYKETYKDGKKDGPWVGFLKDGQLYYKGTYEDGKKDGPWIHYFRDGTVNEKYTGTLKDSVKVK
jgi:antitoxin component YwqK of YwqJK toxin-antitoxin module